VPKIIKIGYFLTELLKKIKCGVWTFWGRHGVDPSCATFAWPIIGNYDAIHKTAEAAPPDED